MIDINNLTIGQAKELTAMFNKKPYCDDNFTSFIGERCIVRGYASGVFFGTVVKHSDRIVEMRDVRRLWSWKAKSGISLSAVATVGVTPKECHFPQITPSHIILDAIEIIPVSTEAAATIDATPVAGA